MRCGYWCLFLGTTARCVRMDCGNNNADNTLDDKISVEQEDSQLVRRHRMIQMVENGTNIMSLSGVIRCDVNDYAHALSTNRTDRKQHHGAHFLDANKERISPLMHEFGCSVRDTIQSGRFKTENEFEIEPKVRRMNQRSGFST